jgi:Cytochrome P460
MNPRQPHQPRQPRLRPLLLAFALLGCGESDHVERADGDEDPPDDVEVDEEAVLAEARDYKSSLMKFSTEPELSETHSDAASVVVWGSPEAADKFRSIDPKDPTQALSFDRDTLLVKEHLDVNNATIGWTVMFKAADGYDPEFGDWYWARISGDDTTHSGKVAWCRDCHEAAHNTDFVVGFGKSP